MSTFILSNLTLQSKPAPCIYPTVGEAGRLIMLFPNLSDAAQDVISDICIRGYNNDSFAQINKAAGGNADVFRAIEPMEVRLQAALTVPEPACDCCLCDGVNSVDCMNSESFYDWYVNPFINSVEGGR